MKGIEHSDFISTRYLSEIDEALVSILNSYPPIAIGASMVLSLAHALFVQHPNVIQWILHDTADALVVHGLIFRFNCDDIQQPTLYSFIVSFIFENNTLLLNFFSNPQRSQHHAVDCRTHNSVTTRCFSYIFNRRLTHFPEIRHWASKSKRRPWLWGWRKPKGVITNRQKVMWRRNEHVGCSKKLQPFWALVLALKYLPYLLNEATRSEELIALAKMWSYWYSLPVSFFPRDTKRAGKAVKRYLALFGWKATGGFSCTVLYRSNTS